MARPRTVIVNVLLYRFERVDVCVCVCVSLSFNELTELIFPLFFPFLRKGTSLTLVKNELKVTLLASVSSRYIKPVAVWYCSGSNRVRCERQSERERFKRT